MKTLYIVTTTLERKDDAERIAGLLLKRKLIACAQISSPITSCYRWNNKSVTSTEFTLAVKTTPEFLEAVIQNIAQEHPYEIPEILTQNIDKINSDYLEWVYKEVQQ
jgi:periplasmic divalent cation tolerance protein